MRAGCRNWIPSGLSVKQQGIANFALVVSQSEKLERLRARFYASQAPFPWSRFA
jgi:hypothetical protein